MLEHGVDAQAGLAQGDPLVLVTRFHDFEHYLDQVVLVGRPFVHTHSRGQHARVDTRACALPQLLWGWWGLLLLPWPCP